MLLWQEHHYKAAAQPGHGPPKGTVPSQKKPLVTLWVCHVARVTFCVRLYRVRVPVLPEPALARLDVVMVPKYVLGPLLLGEYNVSVL